MDRTAVIRQVQIVRAVAVVMMMTTTRTIIAGLTEKGIIGRLFALVHFDLKVLYLPIASWKSCDPEGGRWVPC